jgi:hypothetical protein
MAAAYEDARKVWAENRERYALTGILSDAVSTTFILFSGLLICVPP